MQTVRISNPTRGSVLGERIDVADTSLTRMKGLLGRKGLDPGTGLLIIPSQAVHTLGMRFPIDVLFLDKHCRVLHVQPSLVPYRLSGLHWKARSVLELPPGVIALSSTAVGDELLIED
jgi:uncharacterized membrane protein (UPF0127 family)